MRVGCLVIIRQAGEIGIHLLTCCFALPLPPINLSTVHRELSYRPATMSSSAIAIPKRKQPARNSYQSSYAATPSSYSSVSLLNGSPSEPGNLSKKPVRDEDDGKERVQARRPSLLGKVSLSGLEMRRVQRRTRKNALLTGYTYTGSSFTQSSYTVVNLGREDGPPRLVCCRFQ